MDFHGQRVFSLSDVLVKTLGQRLHPTELTFARYAIGFLMLSPVFLRMGAKELATQKIHLHLMRLALAGTAQLGVFVAIIHLYLADATALAFTRPLCTTVIAVLVLSEIVSWRRWSATAVGFIGVLIMIRPGAAPVDPMMIVAIVSALLFASSNIVIRLMAPTEPPMRILFYYQLGGMILFAGPAWYFWEQPIGAEWLYLILIGVATTLAIMFFIRAFSVGEANAVGPIEYSRLIFAAMFGFLIFGEIPSTWTGIGAAVIAGATFCITRDEIRAGNKPTGPAG